MVVRVTSETGSTFVVKLGFSITIDEYHNQRRALELIDQDIVKVPAVFGFFTHQGMG